MAPPVLVYEDVDGLLVGEDLLGDGHGVHLLSGGQYFECRTTRNIWSGVAPPLPLGDEDEAVLLVDEEAQHLLRLSHVIHIPGLNHVTVVLIVTSSVKGKTAAVAFSHLKTHPLKVLERMSQSVIVKLCLQVLSSFPLSSLLYPLT